MTETRPKSMLRRLSPPTRIVIAMIFGGLTGAMLGSRARGAEEVGKVVISLIKMLATPLIFFAVLDAFLRTSVRARSGLIVLGICGINAACAIVIALMLVNTLRPGRFLSVPIDQLAPARTLPPVRSVHFLDDLIGLLPTNLIDPFRTNAVVPVVFLAVLGGAALRQYKDEQIALGRRDYLALENLVTGSLRTLELILGWIVALLPIAVFAVIAQTVGTQGLAPLRGLLAYVGVVVLGLAIHVGLTYQAWVVLVARMSLEKFWKAVSAPLACAAGSGSSLATLPVTLASLKTAGVSDGSARMSACVATNLNNDGILLYEAMAALMVAQAYGISLAVGDQLMLAAICVLASIGIVGIPEAGLVSLAVVLTSTKLPLDLLPLLLSVDWILGRCRAMTNVVADMLGAVLLDRFAPPSAVGRDTDGPVDEPSPLAIAAR